MKIEMEYKGRKYNSVSSMMKAMERDVVQDAEREITRQARISGLKARKTLKGVTFEGSERQLKRFKRRIGR